MTQASKQRRRTAAAPATPAKAARTRTALDRGLDADLFRALADPTRLALLACLAKCGRACMVGEIAACCAVDLSVVSRHLALLERAGVLESRREGRTTWYAVRYDDLSSRLRAIADALDACQGPGAACCAAPTSHAASACCAPPPSPIGEIP